MAVITECISTKPGRCGGALNRSNELDANGRGNYRNDDFSPNLLQRMTPGITGASYGPRLPSSVIFVRVARAALRRWSKKSGIYGKLKQGYDFKRLLGPFLIGVREVGAGGCSIRESEGALTKHYFELELAAENNPRGEDSESAGTILNGALFKNA